MSTSFGRELICGSTAGKLSCFFLMRRHVNERAAFTYSYDITMPGRTLLGGLEFEAVALRKEFQWIVINNFFDLRFAVSAFSHFLDEVGNGQRI